MGSISHQGRIPFQVTLPDGKIEYSFMTLNEMFKEKRLLEKSYPDTKIEFLVWEGGWKWIDGDGHVKVP